MNISSAKGIIKLNKDYDLHSAKYRVFEGSKREVTLQIQKNE